jgi:hypothetical protein
MFFRRKRPLTEICERVSLRMIGNAAEADPSDPEFDLKRFAKHPKRSTILHMIITLMAADFWKQTNAIADDPDRMVSANPFRSTNSDVIVAEALVFFCYNFILFTDHAVRQKELSESDTEAIITAGATVSNTIQSSLQISISEIFRSRMSEYNDDPSRNPVEVFSRVLLRSIGKQAINDPDRAASPLDIVDYQMPVVIRTTTYMTSMLPAYWQTYKNIVEHYSMD